MSTSRSVTTFSHVLILLPDKGYGNELKINLAGANFDGSENLYNPEQPKITKMYRFEGDSDPGDMAVIYLLESDLRGIILILGFLQRSG